MTRKMTNNHFMTILVTMAAIALANACEKTETKDAYTKQDSNIEAIVGSLAPESSDATVDYIDGTVRVTVEHGDGNELGDGGTVSFFYAGYLITGSSISASNLFVTNNKEFAESSNWTVSDTSVFKVSTINLSKDKIVKGLKKGLPGVKSGDECYILFNGKYGFGKHTTGKVPGNSALVYHLWISDVADN